MTLSTRHSRWKTRPLVEVATIDRRIVDPATVAKGTRYIGLEHIDGDGQFAGEQLVGPNDLASAKFAFGPQHVLYGKLRPYLKKTSLPSFQGICSTDILPIRPSPSLSREYLYYFLRLPSVVQFITGRCSGANLPRISPSQLEELPIPLPHADDPPRSLAEQRRLAAILAKADDIRRKRREVVGCFASLTLSAFLRAFGAATTQRTT